jgi:hypothetical protein
MRNTALFLLLSFLLFGCSEVPTEAPQDAAVDSPDSKVVADFPGTLGKNVNWDINRYFGEGDRAVAYWSSGNQRGYIYASRDEKRNQTWVWYWVRVNGNTVEYGHGEIPNGDLTGSYDQGWMRLETDVSEGANPNIHRHVGSGGKISVTWKKTNEWWRESGSYHVEMYAWHGHGHAGKGRYHNNSAPASGKVVGYSVSPPNWPGDQYLGWFKDLHMWFYYDD